MALERQIQILVTDSSGDTLTTAISDVNPNAIAQKLNKTVTAMNNLSTNTYVDTYVIDTQSLNEMISQ